MKPKTTIHMFGKFSMHYGDRELPLHTSRKSTELLCYLVANRRSPVPREALASILCRDAPVEKSRKALRQALWELRADLCAGGNSAGARILSFAPGWVQFTASDHTWLDVAEFEKAALGHASQVRPTRAVTKLLYVVQLYAGEFLQGLYQDWCLVERERLKQIYLGALDGILLHFESSRNVTAGVAYAALALRSDPGRECTHRSLMRLYCLAGDRASAIHQYERCVESLRTELGVGPDDETRALAKAIKRGCSTSRTQTLRDRSLEARTHAIPHEGSGGQSPKRNLPVRSGR